MRLERLDINDFGIFSNQTMKDIKPGVVVIGGLNRAGKTTMLQILRYLGYGFPQDGSLPSPRNRYRVGADIRLETGARYNLSLEGHGEPKLNRLDSRIDEIEISCQDIYHNLDSFTYQQLFTISLDELQQVPVESEQQKRLQSILLGAGLSDIIGIQNISQDLKKEAEDIGGTRGACDVYDFKVYNEQINQGLQLRQEALKELDIYRHTAEEMDEVKKEIAAKEQEIDYIEAKITVLDILKNNFTTWQEKKELELRLEEYDEQTLNHNYYSEKGLGQAQTLKDDYQAAEDEYITQRDRFKAEVTEENVDQAVDKLLSIREQVNYFYGRLSGFKEKINNIIEQERNNQQKRAEILNRIEQQNNNWQDFESVLSIETDQIAGSKLNQSINQYQKLSRELKAVESELQDLEGEKDRIEDRIGSIGDTNSTQAMNRYYFLGAGFIGLGLASFLWINNWMGIIIGLAGVIGSGLNYLTNYLAQSKVIDHKQELELDLEKVTGQITAKERKVKELKSRLEALTDRLDQYRQLFSLPEDCNSNLIKDTLRSLQDIKERIRDLKVRERRLNKRKKEVKEELEELHRLINDISIYLDNSQSHWNQEALIQKSDRLFTQLEELYGFMELAVGLNQAKRQKEELAVKIKKLLPNKEGEINLEKDLNSFINKCKEYSEFKELKAEVRDLRKNILATLTIDRVKKAFETLEESDTIADLDDEKLLGSFNSFFEDYTSLEDVTEEYKAEIDYRDSLLERIDSLKNRRQSLLDKKEKLATSDKLKQAQRQIDQARAGLKPLAEEFAVRRAASFILDNVRERCIDKVKEELLSPAGDILQRLTGDEYRKILPQDSLTEVDFKLKLQNEDIQPTTDILSRGTKEQVFLSVRLSRIEELEGSLPIILDDSLVNFDAYHLNQAVSILNELAESHQVFLLTCHSELVKYVTAQTEDAQYWKLDQGEFSLLDDGQQLIDYLSV